MTIYSYGCRSIDHHCPKCAGNIVRIRRHWPDRLIGKLFGLMQRFRCEQFDCHWEGILLVANEGNTAPARIKPLLSYLTDGKLRRSSRPLSPP